MIKTGFDTIPSMISFLQLNVFWSSFSYQEKVASMVPFLQLNAATLGSDLWTVLALFYLVWVFSWAKKALGGAKLAILFAVIVVYLAFFLHPDLVWIPVLLFLLANFFSPMLEKVDVFNK